MLMTGTEYKNSLKDNRELFINGCRVDDVTTHPAFRNVVDSVARLYDMQFDPKYAPLLTYQSEDGTLCNRIWQLPGNYETLVKRRQALETWTEPHGGFLGRAPDHVASCIAGMYAGLEVFKQQAPEYAERLAKYYRYARDNNLYLTYTIINPQTARGVDEENTPTLHMVAKDDEGITVRGTKMLATGAVVANEVFVTSIQPLRPDQETEALSFAIPMNAKGLKVLSRKSYEASSPNVFDNPLSSRFDENDSVMYFDDVKVPWERVFACENRDLCQQQFHATPAHVYQNYQAQIRLMVKMRFLVGLAYKITEINSIQGLPPVKEILGQLAADCALVEGLVTSMEVKGELYGDYFMPDRHTLYAAQVLTQQLYPELMTALRNLAGGGMIMLPSSYLDFGNPETRDVIDKVQGSPTVSAEERVKLMNLAWDAVGSEFASRHTQYEMFYAGATFVTKNHSFRTFDWQRSTTLVDRMLGGYSLSDTLSSEIEKTNVSS